MFDDWLNSLPQTSHWCGFAPLCIISCFFKSDFRRKLLSHLAQLKGLTLVWMRRWVDKLDIRLKYFPHTLQLKLVSMFLLPSLRIGFSCSLLLGDICNLSQLKLWKILGLIWDSCVIGSWYSTFDSVWNTSFVSLQLDELEGENWFS